MSVITPTIAGPFLTKSVPSSLQVLLSPLTGRYHILLRQLVPFLLVDEIVIASYTYEGNTELFGILTAVNSRMGSLALAHVEDICRAHIFVMEQASAHGRYICCAQSCPLPKFVKYLAEEYPCMNSIRY